MFSFFFFQAEDGIRDLYVTGVQTCALPIWARQELRAAGETSGRRRTAEAWDQLTPQELQIAQMAADGLSNRELGQQLYLSHRTVGSYLYRVFPKLGITSRSQLRAVLDGGIASLA